MKGNFMLAIMSIGVKMLTLKTRAKMPQDIPRRCLLLWSGRRQNFIAGRIWRLDVGCSVGA